MNYLKRWGTSIALILSMVIGVTIGLIFKDKASYIAPLGELFINLLSVVIAPLIFVTVTLAIAKIRPRKAFKLIRRIFVVFILMAIISVAVGVAATYAYNFVSTSALNSMDGSVTSEAMNYLEKFVSMFSVSDFTELISKNNIIALITFSILTGISINSLDNKEKIIKGLETANEIIMNIIKIIMYYAPIGICAYFASMVGSFGASVATSYLKVFIYYTVISIIFAIVVYSLIALLCGKSIKTFWKESLPVILCSLGTCSSAATLPVNVKAIKNMGVNEDVCNTTLSLGTSFHKDGSVIDSVFKIMFLVYLFGSSISVFEVCLVAIVASLLITAVPVGGGTISEMLIITLLGFPISALPILTIIATITDAPATMLNSLGDTAASLWINKGSRISGVK